MNESLSQIAMSRKNWIISPHPDDELIGPGGLLAKNSKDFFVICITDGGGSVSSVVKSEKQRAELVKQRLEDDLLGLKILNSQNYLFLKFSEVKSKESRAIFKEKIKKILVTGKPENIFIPSPYENEKEVKTHRIVAEVIIESLREVYKSLYNQSGLRVYGYEVWDEIPKGPEIIIEDITQELGLVKAAITVHKTEKALDLASLKEARAKVVAIASENKPSKFQYGERFLDMTPLLNSSLSLDEYIKSRNPADYSPKFGVFSP